MAMTTGQRTTLAAHIRASVDPAVVAALAIRNDSELTRLYNLDGATDAWVSSMTAQLLFEASDITKFDSLTAGKRDAWRMMLDFSPTDCTRQKNRKAIQDVWGNQDSIAVLQSCTRKATVGESVFGGESATTNTVTATKLAYEGSITAEDIGRALNENGA